MAVLELSRYKPGGGLYVGEQLAKFSTATGKVTATLNNLNVARMGGYEQILYTNPSGNVLVVSNARPGMSAGVLHEGTYTPIPWSTHIATAAW